MPISRDARRIRGRKTKELGPNFNKKRVKTRTTTRMLTMMDLALLVRWIKFLCFHAFLGQCKRPDGNKVEWVYCERCAKWYHMFCLNVNPKDVRDDPDFVCSNCQILEAATS